MSDREFERRHAFTNLAESEINDLVAPAFGSKVLRSATPLSGGRVNSNYALDLNTGPPKAVLRLYARGPNTCRLERDVLYALEAHPLAAEVLYDGSGAPTPFLILGWIEGDTLDHVLVSTPDAAALGTQAGQTLASIHEIAFPASGFLGEGLQVTDPFPHGSAVFLSFVSPALEGRAGQRLGTERTAELNSFIQWAAPLLDQLPETACLVHSDFNPPNLMAHEGQLSGVLDWEFAHAGSPLTDIANMLRPRPYQPPAFDAAFVSTYEKAAGPLPQNWQSLSRILDMMAQIEMLDAPEDRPSIFKWATDRITDTIAFVEKNTLKR